MKKKNYSLLFKAGCVAMFIGAASMNAQEKVTAETKGIKVQADADEDGDEKGMSCTGGTERWSQKVLTDAAHTQINFTPVVKTVSQMVALTTPTPSTTMPRTAPIETTTYTTNCTITIKKAETDNDYHLVLYDGSKTMIGEIPDPTCSGTSGSAYVSQYTACRQFIDAHIASGNVSNVNIPPVVVTGVGFIDPPHGQTGAAANNMELHPILDIHFQTATGIADESKLLDVTVGPNPFSTSTEFKLRTKLNNFSKVTLVLFDILGQEVRDVQIPVTSNSEINYTLLKDDLKSGVYFYRFRNEGLILYEGRVVVQ